MTEIVEMIGECPYCDEQFTHEFDFDESHRTINENFGSSPFEKTKCDGCEKEFEAKARYNISLEIIA